MTKKAYLLFWALAVGFGAGCDVGRNRVSSQPVVKVNDQSLSAKDFADQLARELRRFDALMAKDPTIVSEAKEKIVRRFIISSLTEQYAEKNNLLPTDEEIAAEINTTRSQYPDDISFRRSLAEEGLAFNDWKRDLRASLIEKKVLSSIGSKITEPSDAELKSLYEEKKEKFRRKDRILLRQIVLDDLTKAQAVKDQLKKGDFSGLAKKFSVAPEASTGGLVGWVEKGTVDIFDKAFSLPVGGQSEVLESIYGFHIFKVEDKQAAGFQGPTEVAEILRQELISRRQQALFMGWLDVQVRANKVFKNSALITSIKVETKGDVK
jgi:peptidyl-prolyl cis-trans isomerase C